MSTLGIFSVKKLRKHAGCYYTYGGFGEYLTAMRAAFHRVVLVAHVKESEPTDGHYLIPPGDDLKVVHLPHVTTELGALLTLPHMFVRSWNAVPTMDIAHCRMPDYTGVVGAIVCRLRRKPYFCQIVADWRIQAKTTPIAKKGGLGLLLKGHLYLYDFIEQLVCRNQMVFAQGDSCYQKHRHHSDCELTLSSAHHAADVVSPQSVVRFRGRPYTLLTVARLTSVKNQALTIHALAKLRRCGEDWRAVFVGEGPSQPALVELAKELGVAGFMTFPGQIGHGVALWRHFDLADCFVLSSRSEGTPKVLLEAMARELPIVASNVGGIPTLVSHGQRGLLFQDNDVDGLVFAIRQIAMDHDLRRAMVSNGRAFALEHTVERQTDRMIGKVFRRWPQLNDHMRPNSPYTA